MVKATKIGSPQSATSPPRVRRRPPLSRWAAALHTGLGLLSGVSPNAARWPGAFITVSPRCARWLLCLPLAGNRADRTLPGGGDRVRILGSGPPARLQLPLGREWGTCGEAWGWRSPLWGSGGQRSHQAGDSAG